MSKRGLLLITVIGLASIFGVAGLYAGTTAPDVIALKSDVYDTHTKGIIQFSHKKHAAEYGAGCGDCHHDDKGQPLTDLKEGDEVKKCSACHSETGKPPKGIKKAERIKRFHKDALHGNCRDCHKDWNKKKGYRRNDPKAAPESCNDCHPKEKK